MQRDCDGLVSSANSGLAVPHRRIALLLLLCVAVESILLLSQPVYRSPEVLGGDGPQYQQLALNLLDHASYSLEPTPPYAPTVYRAPGYPIFIALVYAVGGRHPLSVRISQCVLFGLTAWLLYLLALHYASPRTATLAALLYATCLPFLFEAGSQLTETTATFLAVLSILLLVRSLRDGRGRTATAFWTGVAIALATFMRPSMMLLVGIAVLALAFQTSPQASWRERGWRCASLLAGFCLCVLPWTLRNKGVSGQFIPVAVGSGASLFLSAQQYANEISYRITPDEWHISIVETARRNQEFAAAIKQGKFPLPAHASPVAWRDVLVDRSFAVDGRAKLRGLRPGQILRSVPQRLFYLWSPAGSTSTPGLMYYVIRLQYALLVLLIGWGCWLNRQQLRQQWPLWIFPCYFTLVHLIFHEEPRYTFPARPFLLIYAGLALTHLLSFRQMKVTDSASNEVI